MLRRWLMPAASLRWNVAMSPSALVGSIRSGVYMTASPYLRLRELACVTGLLRDLEAVAPLFATIFLATTFLAATFLTAAFLMTAFLAVTLRAVATGAFATDFFTAERFGLT